MMRRSMLLVLIALAGGCSVNPADFARAPPLSAVGSGLLADRVPVASEPAPAPVYRRGNSIWQDSRADLFRDPRARKIGDVVTVKISIKDKASLDNNSKRSRDAKMTFEPKLGYDISMGSMHNQGDSKIDASVDSTTSTDSKGGIERSESIELLVAAVVTGVLPNGNLIISGSQEVRVNFELRDLSVAGIVRPRDIATDNTISYEKIAEARIAYGGRGRITEVQQPAIGQQLFDILTPY
ncbi:MAG TPA: flagellar basal body L-ring protein FlgH [Hyphomicrobiaceae bacterium]|nr:flagellar basal body L-ring protein FlgH [Hyphomicrobiaceae bacterium]